LTWPRSQKSITEPSLPGVVVRSTGQEASPACFEQPKGDRPSDRDGEDSVYAEMEDDEGKEEKAKILREVAGFDEIVIWGHEAVPEADDHFVRGVEEWIGFAETMHACAGSEEQSGDAPSGEGKG
jgi:hypothetical protein